MKFVGTFGKAKKSALLAGLFLAATSAHAQMIEVGVGGLLNGDGSTSVESVASLNDTEVLIHVSGEISGGGSAGVGGYDVIGRMSADATTNGSYLDITFEPLVLGQSVVDADGAKMFGELSLLKTDIERDLSLDKDLMRKITIAGIRLGRNGQLTDNLKAGINLTLDILSLTLIKRHSDGLSTSSPSTGAGIEGTLDYKDRFRIALGTKFTEMPQGSHDLNFSSEQDAADHGYDPNAVCTTTSVDTGEYFYDDNGVAHEIYADSESCGTTLYDQIQRVGKTYLSLSAQITKHLQIFGVAQYSFYSVSTDTGRTLPSHSGRMELLLGGSVSMP